MCGKVAPKTSRESLADEIRCIDVHECVPEVWMSSYAACECASAVNGVKKGCLC